MLQLMSCDEMQGFLFSKAVPAADFEAAFLEPLADAAARARTGKALAGGTQARIS